MAKTMGYKDAVRWIAYNDAPGDRCNAEELSSLLTVCLLADMFGKDQKKVAQDVYNVRVKEGLNEKTNQD